MRVCTSSNARGIDILKLVYLMIFLFESTGDRTKNSWTLGKSDFCGTYPALNSYISKYV